MENTNHSLDAASLLQSQQRQLPHAAQSPGPSNLDAVPPVFSTGLEAQHGEKCSLCLPVNPPQGTLSQLHFGFWPSSSYDSLTPH